MEYEAFVTEIKSFMGKMSDEIESFKTTQLEKMKEIDEKGAVSEELQEKLASLGKKLDGMEEQKTDFLKRLEEMEVNAKRHANGEDGRPEGQPFESFGEQIKAIIDHENPQIKTDARLLQVKAPTGLSETVNSDGGFLVQTDFSTDLMKRTYEIGQVSSRVRMIPVSTNANGLRIPGVDETSRAQGQRYGGVRVYWEKEANDITASQPKFRMIELHLKKLTGMTYLTEELIQDAAALQAFVQMVFPEEMNYVLEESLIRGTGAGEPQGFMTSGAVVQVDKEPDQDTGSIVYENIINMWARMWNRSRQNAVWLINQDCEPQLHKMYIAVGTGGVPVYMPPGGVSGVPYGTLMGKPVIPVEYCSTVGTVGDIILTDMSQMVGIDKGGIKQDQSIHVRFVQAETALRFLYRADAQPMWNAPLTPANGTNTQSPHIVLQTRA